MGLEYLYIEGKKACSTEPLPVKLNGRLIGHIRKYKKGFQFLGNDEKEGGIIYSSVCDVQNSLNKLQTKPPKSNEPESDSDIMEQAKAGLKKLEKDLKKSEAVVERDTTLLQACYEILNYQTNCNEVLNVLTQEVHYDGTDCDGHTLLEDLAEHLNIDKG